MVKVCVGLPLSPGIYARVSSVANWIDQTTCLFSDDRPAQLQCTAIAFQITYDEYYGETSWYLLNEDYEPIIYSKAGTSSGLVHQQVQVPPGKYTLLVMDSMGDGICCDYGLGFIVVRTGQEMHVLEGDFAYESKLEFVVHPNNNNNATSNGAATAQDKVSSKTSRSSSSSTTPVATHDTFPRKTNMKRPPKSNNSKEKKDLSKWNQQHVGADIQHTVVANTQKKTAQRSEAEQQEVTKQRVVHDYNYNSPGRADRSAATPTPLRTSYDTAGTSRTYWWRLLYYASSTISLVVGLLL